MAFGWSVLALGFGLASPAFAASDETRGISGQHPSLQHEVQRAIDRGLSWLEAEQADEGYWSTADHPAITGLALSAFRNNPDAESRESARDPVERGYEFILKHVHPDGAIYNKRSLRNYNTAICLMALLAADNPDYTPIIRKARRFLVNMQFDFGVPGKLDDPMDGGIGYGTSYNHPDLANTLSALEALYHSRHLVEDDPSIGSDARLDWDAAVHFVENCQNLPSHNDQEWVSGDPRNRGGFVYFPGKSHAGEMELSDGRVALRSYGSISYTGLLSYIYADLDADDPRVEAVINWLKENWTLEENPGMGLQGLYYYYHTMAKALSAYGVDRIQTPEGKEVDWREALALELFDRQREDGSWVNENGRWWENDPALVTCYSVLALEFIHQGL